MEVKEVIEVKEVKEVIAPVGRYKLKPIVFLPEYA